MVVVRSQSGGNDEVLVSPAVQIIPSAVNTSSTIKVLKQSRGPRTPRISGGEERSSPGNRTGTHAHAKTNAPMNKQLIRKHTHTGA